MLLPLLLLATRNGLSLCERNGNDWREQTRALIDHEITCVTARDGAIIAGTTDGLFHSGDDGQTWSEASGLTARHVRWLAFDPNGAALAGMEPASIFASSDGGKRGANAPTLPR